MTGTGEAVLFWVLAPVMVVSASGLLLAKKAVHAALCVALVMVSLAFLYAAQDAPFLAVSQVVVYTGAVMMLFLFVLMLVGVDSADSLVETLRGQRAAGLLLAAGLAALLLAAVGSVQLGEPAGLAAANEDTNPVGVARIIFSDFVLPFEATGALLITAALGAILLTHRERLGPRTTQRELARRRVAAGTQVPPLPAPGVYARHNAVDTPALLPDGSPSELSVSRVLAARGQRRPVGEPDVAALEERIAGGVPPHSRTGAVPGSVTGTGGGTTATQGPGSDPLSGDARTGDESR